jgi:hypothetical protein
VARATLYGSAILFGLPLAASQMLVGTIRSPTREPGPPWEGRPSGPLASGCGPGSCAPSRDVDADEADTVATGSVLARAPEVPPHTAPRAHVEHVVQSSLRECGS